MLGQGDGWEDSLTLDIAGAGLDSKCNSGARRDIVPLEAEHMVQCTPVWMPKTQREHNFNVFWNHLP